MHKGRALTLTETHHLETLIEARDHAKERARTHTAAVEDYVLELREAGCSARGIAAAIGAGYSTVQGWTKNARRRR